MLAHCLRRWPCIKPALVQRLVFAGLCSFNCSWSGITYCWRRLQADTDPMSVKCWASVAGASQYPFSPSQYFMLPVRAQCFEPKLDCDAGPHSAWRQTRHAYPILGQCWLSVVDGGPTLVQHWVNVSCLG